jgi:hypothetical protein
MRGQLSTQAFQPPDVLRDELVCLFALYASRVHPLLPVLLCCLSSAHRSSGLDLRVDCGVLTGIRGGFGHPRRGRAARRCHARSAISSVCHFPRWEVDRGEPVATARLWEPVGISPPVARCRCSGGYVCFRLRGDVMRWRYVSWSVAGHWPVHVRGPCPRDGRVADTPTGTTLLLWLARSTAARGLTAMLARTPW